LQLTELTLVCSYLHVVDRNVVETTLADDAGSNDVRVVTAVT